MQLSAVIHKENIMTEEELENMEILEKMVETYRNGEGVKFERPDIRHEQETFERIRREYDIQEE